MLFEMRCVEEMMVKSFDRAFAFRTARWPRRVAHATVGAQVH
jgi:hypothetical protein